MIKICVSGSKGKMGSRILALAKEDAAFKVAGEFDIGAGPEPYIKGCDCLIEFTTPQATVEHMSLCEKYKKAMVIGTTGLTDAEKDRIQQISGKIPVVFSANMSVGVNVLFQLAEDAAKALGPAYRVRIQEAHHIHKKDSPSGTAKELARIVKQALSGSEVPINAAREGEIIGDHKVIFESAVDKIELFHSAKTRDIFARGALEAAKFVTGKSSGLYSMKDVLGL